MESAATALAAAAEQYSKAEGEIFEAAAAVAADAAEAGNQGWAEQPTDIEYNQKGTSFGKGNSFQGGKGMSLMQMLQGPYKGMKGGGKLFQASNAKGPYKGGGKSGGKGNPLCYSCGKTGHIARNCPQSNSKSTMKCNRCNRLGFMSKDCRTAFPAREVEEEEEEAINWACMIDEQSDVNMAEEKNSARTIEVCLANNGRVEQAKSRIAEPR